MGEETFLVGVWLSRAQPLECFLPKKIEDKTGENKSGLKHPCVVALTLPRFSVLLSFFFSLISKLGFAQFLLWCLFRLWFSFSVLSFSVQLLLSFFNFLLFFSFFVVSILFFFLWFIPFFFFFSFFLIFLSSRSIKVNLYKLNFYPSIFSP